MSKRAKPPKGQKGPKAPKLTPTLPFSPNAPPPIMTKAQQVAAAAAQQVRERAAFAARQRAAIEKAALELDTLDASLLRYSLQFPGLTQEQLGNLVGLGRKAVAERMHAPKFARAVATASRSALEIFGDNKRRAAVKLGELIDNPDPHIAIRASIAHMWPHIHASDDVGDANDFVKFLVEAYEQAEAQRVPMPVPIES